MINSVYISVLFNITTIKVRKLFILWLLPFWTFAQVNEATLNPFVDYTNESIHGMLIIHRMLENFNQQLNKFVDLESTQVNFYGNDDLPKNIFDDEDHLFYDTTPYEWYHICKQRIKDNSQLSDLLIPLDQMKRSSDELNQLRFDLNSLITTLDLEQSTNQKIIYKKLSRGVALYDQFAEAKSLMSTSLASYLSPSADPLISSLSNLNTVITDIFSKIKSKETEKIADLNVELKTTLEAIPRGTGLELLEIKRLTAEVVADLDLYVTRPKIDGAYRQYGYFYFYHNVKIINKINRYGNGIVYQINQILRKKKSGILAMEIPHYFKVIYPIKEEVTPFTASLENLIESTPEELEKRLIIAHQQSIVVDNSQVEFLIFDHKEQDGDVMSLNFNGDWILNNHALTKKPLPLKLSLNNEGKNYLVLHAVNTGSRPPNTVAITYFYKGKRNQIILNSDLEHSEMIEIEIDDSDN